MCRSSALVAAALLLPIPGGIPVMAGDDAPVPKERTKLEPPGGVPLPVVGPKGEYAVEGLNRVSARLEAAPKDDLDKWVAELERITDQKLDGDAAKQACRTYFVTRFSVAFDDLKWNPRAAGGLLKRARTLPASEAKAWEEAFEAVLKKEIGQTDTTNHPGGPAYAVPLVLIPLDALHGGQKYVAERGKKYRARLTQLTADDVALWQDKVDRFGGTKLDAATNIILRDDYFEKERFQRDKFKADAGDLKQIQKPEVRRGSCDHPADDHPHPPPPVASRVPPRQYGVDPAPEVRPPPPVDGGRAGEQDCGHQAPTGARRPAAGGCGTEAGRPGRAYSGKLRARSGGRPDGDDGWRSRPGLL